MQMERISRTIYRNQGRYERKDSYHQIPNFVFEHLDIIGPSGYLVYGGLMSHYNRTTKRCHPGIRRLCALLKLDSHTVINALIRLEETNLIEIKKKTGHVNNYSFLTKKEVYEKSQQTVGNIPPQRRKNSNVTKLNN